MLAGLQRTQMSFYFRLDTFFTTINGSVQDPNYPMAPTLARPLHGCKDSNVLAYDMRYLQ